MGTSSMGPTLAGKPGTWENILPLGKSRGILNRLEKSGNFEDCHSLKFPQITYSHVQQVSELNCNSSPHLTSTVKDH